MPSTEQKPLPDIQAALSGVADSLEGIPKEADELTLKAEAYWVGIEARARATGAWQDVSERKIYATRLFCLVVAWLGLDTIVIFSQGMGGLLFWKFYLSDTVIIAILTTSTATVVGLLVIVARYLFPRKI